MQTYQMLIDGKWLNAQNDAVIDVENPSTGDIIGRVACASVQDVDTALKAAQMAFPNWAGLTGFQRGDLLHRAGQILEDRKKEIGAYVTLEQGKPLNEAIGEVEKCVEMLHFYAEEGMRVLGTVIPNTDSLDRSLVIKQPVGVVAALSPWNYPIELIGWKTAACLAAGCTIVAKPPSLTPISPLLYYRCLADAGIPPGVINMLPGSGSTVGRQLVASPVPAKIAFTGSLAVGLKIQDQAKDRIKKLSLELGGQCPLIVSSNADLDSAVKGAVRRSFRNMGQICIAINRIYAHESIYEAFLSNFSTVVRELTIADGIENPAADVGPMASAEGLEKTQLHIRDALDKGARLVCGGRRPPGDRFAKGHFFKPTIIADASHDMLIMTEETFGPAVGVQTYRTLDEAIRLANDTPYGLAAYAYTDNLHEAHRFAEELDAGSVAINNVDAGIMNAPYGGWKQSGIGHEHGHEGLEEYLQLKHVRIRNRKL